jgi:hypothetical protein
MIIKNSHCWKCKKETHFVGKEVNHGRWFCLSLLFGFPVILWIYASLTAGFKCNTCGRKEIKL